MSLALHLSESVEHMSRKLSRVSCAIQVILILFVFESCVRFGLLIVHRHDHELFVIVLSLLDMPRRLQIFWDNLFWTVIAPMIVEYCLNCFELFITCYSYWVGILFIVLHDSLGEHWFFRHFQGRFLGESYRLGCIESSDTAIVSAFAVCIRQNHNINAAI